MFSTKFKQLGLKIQYYRQMKNIFLSLKMMLKYGMIFLN